MRSDHDITDTLDVTGLNCPMPVVKAKQAADDLDPGAILEVRATDPGSVSDFQGWAESTGTVELLDQDEVEEDGTTIYRHVVRRVAA